MSGFPWIVRRLARAARFGRAGGRFKEVDEIVAKS
jgi:hypothetical protein